MGPRASLGHGLRSFAALFTSATLTLGACGKKDEPQPESKAPPTAAATTQAEADAGGAPKGLESEQPRREPEAAPVPTGDLTGAFAAPALSLLPASTLMLLSGTPKKLLDGVGYDQLLAANAAQLEPIVKEMQEGTGKNFFDLASWKAIGIDLDAPAGIAMPSAEREGFVAFATLADPAAFRAYVDELAKKAGVTPTEDKAGEASILSIGDKDRAALVLKGNLLVAVVFERGNGAVATAKELVTRAPEASLVKSPTFLAAVGGLASDEAGIYFDIATLAKLTMGGKRAAMATSSLESEINNAKMAGDAARVAQLEQALADERRMNARFEERQRAEQEMVQSVLGGLGGVGIGLDVTGESIEAAFKLPLGPDALLRKLVTNTSGLFPVVKATREAPLFLASLRLDLPGYMSLVEQMMKAEGQDLAEMKAQLKEFVGLDFDKDVLGLFSGELGVTVTGDIKAMMNDAPWNAVSGGLLIGLANPDGMKALLAKLAGVEQLARVLRYDPATGVLTVPLPIDKTVTVQVAGNYLVASVDPDLAARIASGDAAGSFVGAVGNARLKALLDKPDQAGLFVMPQTLGAGWMLAMRGASSGPRFPPPSDPALQAKYDAYMKLSKELDDARDAREAEAMGRMMSVLDKVGVTAEVVAVTPEGLVGTFGQYTKGATVAQVIAEVVALRHAEMGGDEDEALRIKRQELWKLESELMSTRVEEAVPAAPEQPKTP